MQTNIKTLSRRALRARAIERDNILLAHDTEALRHLQEPKALPPRMYGLRHLSVVIGQRKAGGTKWLAPQMITRCARIG